MNYKVMSINKLCLLVYWKGNHLMKWIKPIDCIMNCNDFLVERRQFRCGL